ncbi:TonB-dependent receptor [Flavobacterium sp. 5]|uniref:SusC/RagA family TonB-linked outer membrane protein n=1 Tax=Flavobacterium sp. 5 TaxID=2035199 RepID=UPI000C2C0981|nr:TonB-dependent receptor [Flavobacterium sp. 5]PKB16473.1 TonB-linked SusC/RagA family outer membrane protein [Flavobacterium sp. 5]
MTTNHRLFFYCNFLLPKKEWLIALLLMLISAYTVSAQQSNTVSGKITSEKDGLPLPGVNILVKGSTSGSSTDFDGNYSINAKPTDVLVLSYVGYDNQEITISNRTKINFAMKDSSNKLNEIVVIGYGSQKKADITGAVGIVNMESAKKVIAYDAAKVLQGQVAGVTVQSSGEPGGFVNIKIRGIGSFTNNNPLWVIDGVILDSPYDFATGDIESMQVLKDAATAAIYGVRGANGVVIITTKKGKAGSMIIKYKSTLSMQNVAKRWSLTDRVGYQTIANEAEKNKNLQNNEAIDIAPGNNPNSPYYISNVNTDWQKEAYDTGVIQNHSLGISGGSESLSYNMNLDYFNNDSYLKTPQQYERYAYNLNLTGTKGKFKYGTKISYTQSDKENFNTYFGTAISGLLTAIPTIPVYDANRLGGYGGADAVTQRAISLNVIGFNNLVQNETRRNRFVGNVWAQLEIVKGLKYKINVSADRLDFKNRYYNPPSDLGWYFVVNEEKSTLDASNGSETRTFLDNTLTYDLNVDKHKIEILAGTTNENFNHYNHMSNGLGFQTGEIIHIENADKITTREYQSRVTAKSFISRINYNYDDRYFVQGNFRQDKSSLFTEKNNTSNAYSFSAGWKLSNEKFLTLPTWVNLIKFRGGYGILGNNTLQPYSYAETVNPYINYSFTNNEGVSTTAPGTAVVSAKDPNLKWETSKSSSVALELGLFDNKLQFTGEYYEKITSDLLADGPTPLSSGSFPAFITTNVAKVKNSGLEFTLSYGNNDHAFKYNISGNLSTLKNEVLELNRNNDPIYGAASKTVVGRSIGELYAFETIGIFQSDAEVASSPAQSNARAGDIKFRDVDGDGKITNEDRTFQGSAIPKYNYGLNLSCSYKNFDFSIFFQGNAGNKIFNSTYRDLMAGQYSNASTDMLNFWTPTNTNTNVPRPIIGDPNSNGRDSDRFIESGDYIKLQNSQIGYNIPVTNTKFINKARLFLSGQNLLTFTKYTGNDPDFISDGLFSRAYEGGSFPNPRTITMGVEIEF